MKRSSSSTSSLGGSLPGKSCNGAVYRRNLRDAAGSIRPLAGEMEFSGRPRVRGMAVALVTPSLQRLNRARDRLSFRLRGRNKRPSNYAPLVSTSTPRWVRGRDSSGPDRANSFSLRHFVPRVISHFYPETLEQSVYSTIEKYPH